MRYAKQIWHGVVVLKSTKKPTVFSGIYARSVSDLLRQLCDKYQEVFRIREIYKGEVRYDELDGKPIRFSALDKYLIKGVMGKEGLQDFEQQCLDLDTNKM